MKMRTTKDGWLIEDRGVLKVFETSHDAWSYVFLMKEIRSDALTRTPPTLYPVLSLDPRPQMRGKKYVLHIR